MARIFDHNGDSIDDHNGSALIDHLGLELPDSLELVVISAETNTITVEAEDRYITV